MTETEWLSCSDPQMMLSFLRDRGAGSERKLRLFAVACCRRITSLLSRPTFLQAVRIAEQYADSLAPEEDCRAASDAVYEFYCSSTPEDDIRNCADVAVVWASSVDHPSALYAAKSALSAAERDARTRVTQAAEQRMSVPTLMFPATEQNIAAYLSASQALIAAIEAELDLFVAGVKHEQSVVLRDIFGNPFRPVTLDQSWLSSTVVSLAQGIYEEKSFGRLPILADALADAGCSNDELLDHLRGPGPHVRGCWVVDLLLGKK